MVTFREEAAISWKADEMQCFEFVAIANLAAKPRFELYPLSLIRSRKGNWLHGGSIPLSSTIIN